MLTGSIAPAQTIVCPPDAPANVKLAAKEVRRYVYLRTGKLWTVTEAGKGMVLKIDPSLGAQEYTITAKGIAGGSDLGVLYGAYRYAELLGVRFYLHGDVVPDERLGKLPVANETGKPAFALRGIQPFHDFMEGPDWWNVDDYKAYCAQMVKMRMNFIGLHSYPWYKPWAHVPPEPGVWIGLPEDVEANGHVKFSYPASWANTARPGPLADNAWGHKPGKTSGFSAGASQLFERDDYGANVMEGLTPWPKTPEQCNLLFNRVGDMFGDAFGFARQLGVKVCVGIETPFWVPDEVRAKLKEQARNPDNPAVLRDLCRGMFERIMRSHPVDYFWVWTPERQLDAARTEADLKMVNEVAQQMKLPVGTPPAVGAGWRISLPTSTAPCPRTLPLVASTTSSASPL